MKSLKTFYLLALFLLSGVGGFASNLNFLFSQVDKADTLSYCDTIWPPKSSASSFKYIFTPIEGTPGEITSRITLGAIQLCDETIKLRHNGVYQVVIDAIDNSKDSLENSFHEIGLQKIIIRPYEKMDIKAAQKCPATVTGGSGLKAKREVCGAINYTIELTEIESCEITDSSRKTVYFETPGPKAHRKFCSHELNLHRVYRVRWRPNFHYGPGEFGPSSNCYLINSIVEDFLDCDPFLRMREENEFYPEFDIDEKTPGDIMYKNNVLGYVEVSIMVLDAMGRILGTGECVLKPNSWTYCQELKDILDSINQDGLFLVQIFVDGEAYTEIYSVKGK